MTITDVRPKPAELLRTIGDKGVDFYRTAYAEGMTLTQYLLRNHDDPEYKDGLDPFERMLKSMGIVARSIPERGIWADSMERFFENQGSYMLIPELAARMWRQVVHHNPAAGTRAPYTSDDQVVGSISKPWAVDPDPRYAQIAPAIPLQLLVAITTPIRGDAYKGFYLTDVTAQERQVRVGEGADIPGAKLTGAEQSVRLAKFGRALFASYEVMRRMRIDMLALHIARMAVQTEADKLATAIDVLVNGDGNANTAATSYNLTALDTAAVAGTLTLKGWTAFKMKFTNPYIAAVALAPEAMALQAMLLTAGSANIPLTALAPQTGITAFRQINPGLADGTQLGWTADAPANKILAIDPRFALEYVTEIGADIQEVERWAIRQTEALILSEVDGFKTFDATASKILVVNA